MARYFFDFHDVCFSIRDEDGTECATREAVSSEALRALCQIAADRPERYAGNRLNLVVRDTSNQSVFTASLSLTAAWHVEHNQSEAA